MGIISALETGPTKPNKGATCYTCQWLTGLTPELSEGAQTLLADERYTNTELAEQFKDDGLDVASQSLGRHRLGRCKRS